MVLVTGAMVSVIFKLGKLLSEEYKLQTGVRKKIQALTRDLESMHAALRKVAEVPPNELDDEVKLWACDARELSYNVEDIIDTFLVRVDNHVEDPSPNKLKRAAKKIVKLFSKSKARHQIAKMIKTINEQAEEVAERHRRYRASDIVAKPATTSKVDPRLAAIVQGSVSQLIGFDKSKGELMSMLSSEEGSHGSSNEKMKIVSVVGAAGLGKTTLAKAVYDNLKPRFDYKAFVPVGLNPDLKKVLRDILIDLDKVKYINSSIEKLDERQLLNELRGLFEKRSRYLVVIDDIWDAQSLETIKLALVENNSGCRVLITTRKLEVAKESDHVYKLQPLSYDDSKRLLYTRLFGGENNCQDNHLHELSDQILKKCGGVPLAIITMASLLLGKSREYWIEVCSSPGFCPDKDDRHMENTMHILSLSYYDLPCHLKTCLLYLSVFPEDSLICKDSLIWKWIAEGFVEKKPGRWLFEVGEEYFYDLINRSMIQGVYSEFYGIIYGCRVHDMVLDLIVSKSNEENFVSDGGTLSQSQARRLAPKNRELHITQDTHVDLPQVRSFIVLQCDISKWTLNARLKLICVLALEGCTFREGCHSLEHIGNLLHLRYLGIRGSPIDELPGGIGILKFLQILDMEDTRIQVLPCSIGRLTQLVCLRALEISAPNGVVGRLTSLEELQIGGPHHNNAESWRQFMKDLGNLCELKVLKLNRAWHRMDESVDTDLLQSLSSLQKMQHLRLGGFFTRIVNMNVWDAAAPTRYLRCLFLKGIRFPKLPSWINSAHLPSLSHLVIYLIHIDEQGPKALGGLPELCYLKLSLDDNTVICFTEADGCFQKLRSLVLSNSVEFVAKENSSASFGRSRKQRNNCSGVLAPVVVMPALEELQFHVDVNLIIRCEHHGLEYLPSLQRVKVDLLYDGIFLDDVDREKTALRQAVEIHPKRPALEITYHMKELDLRDAMQQERYTDDWNW